MKEIEIKHLAYFLKQAKDNNQPQPIFFLGAGASRSGNIPLSGEIIEDILKDYSDNPFIQDLPKEERTYPNLMKAIGVDESNRLLKSYIEKAKINVTHIYLAQLLKEGYADYVLTVNFDNLMLRALALYNIFPATYDIAILKDLTTTTFKEKSVVYLHGQSHGLWLLNIPEEMEKVKPIVPRIFDTIKNGRPWVFIGYSGDDPIFEHIKSLGRFDNGLYWVTYNENDPIKKVQEFLSTPNTNSFLIKGHDSDSFFLKLNAALGLGQPDIVDKPFTALKEMLNNIVDIEDKDEFKVVKERLEISKRQVKSSIKRYKEGAVDSSEAPKENVKLDLLKRDIIKLIISEKYPEDVISNIEVRARGIADISLQSLLSSLYFNWGSDLCDLAKTKVGKEADDLYLQAFEKYKEAIQIKPDDHETFNNWGAELGRFASTKEGKEADDLYLQAFEKLKKAIVIKPDFQEAYYNWGVTLVDLASTKEGKEADDLHQQAFEKFKKAIEIKPDFHDAFNNWGTELGRFASTKEGKEADDLYLQAFEKFKKAIEIKPNNHEAYNNWSANLVDFASTKEGKEADDLHQQAFEKFKKAIEIKPDYHNAFFNWGTSLGNLASSKEGKEADDLYLQAFEKYKEAIQIKPDDYETYYNWGTDLGDLTKTKEGKEADDLYLQAFEKFKKATEIKPDFHEAFNNWGDSLGRFASTKEGKEADDLYLLSLNKYQKAVEMGGDCYDLACIYAIDGNKKDALFYLDLCFKKNETSISFVQNDENWKSFLHDVDFMNILNKYRT